MVNIVLDRAAVTDVEMMAENKDILILLMQHSSCDEGPV